MLNFGFFYQYKYYVEHLRTQISTIFIFSTYNYHTSIIAIQWRVMEFRIYAVYAIFVSLASAGVLHEDTLDGTTPQLQRQHESQRGGRTCSYCNNPPDPIYVTPENVDNVLADLTLPSMQTLKERKKPFSFIVEGIVGTGKTTLLSAFQVNIVAFKTCFKKYLYTTFQKK